MSERVLKRFPHKRILASAGSGKTFQLTNRYLDLVAAGAPVGSVLATTFTRAAAGEIRDRVLQRLADAADDERKRDELRRFLGLEALDRAHVLALLRVLARAMHRMQIRTLDSFFGSVVRSFALELGIPSGSDVTDEIEAESIRREAIRLVLDEQDADRLVRLLRAITQGRSDRSVMEVIDRTVRELYEVYREAPAEAWETVDEQVELRGETLVRAIEDLADCAVEKKKTIIDSRAKDLEQALAYDWEGFLSDGIAAKVASGEATYRRVKLTPELVGAYLPLVRHARAHLVNRLREQTIAMRDLLAMYEARYAEVKRRRHAMTFADIAHAMHDAQTSGRFDDICFRIDATIQHLLLDEFQDTSMQQWQALEPIARELVSDETRPRTFFCVGDVKQSIYGWRDACPEILDGIGELLVGPGGSGVIEDEHLAKSYRSSPVIMNVVNETFDGIESNAAIGKHAGGAVLFARGFKAHRTAKTDLAGYFALRTVRRIDDDDESGKQLDVRISEAADLVQRLHAASPHKTIGVLTRTNKAASRMLFELSPGRRDLPASARGGGSFTDAPAVNAVLDLLRLADHPDDTVSAFNVARGPLGRVIEFNDEADRVQRHRTARRVRRMLLERGYAATITAWSNDLAPACDERQYRRLRQLIALADEFDRRPTLRTDDFVALAEARSAVDATPAPIQVMTVHQSKGLEFDIVVLPELDGKSAQLAGSNTAPVAMERDGVTGPITRVCRWVNETTRDMLPDIKPMFDVALQRTVRESLCLLYVAMTRARQGLYILIDPPNMTTKGASTTVPKTMAGVVRAALSEVDGPPEPEATLYERGDEEAMLRSGAMEDETDRVGPMDVTTPIRLAARNGRSMRGVAARPASALHDDDVPLRMKLRVQDDEARLRGSAIHKLFEQIEWLEEFDMDDAALVRFVRREAPRRDEAWARGVVVLFRSALERPDVKHLLSLRGRDPRQMLVHRERPFARLIDGRVQQGFVDRLVMETDGRGAARSAEVIDFKTDDVDADGLAAHAEQYRGQLETYRDVVTGAATLAPDQVGMTLLFVRPGVAIQL